MLFVWDSHSTNTPSRSGSLILVVGLGLIGKSIGELLSSRSNSGTSSQKFQLGWRDQNLIKQQLTEISDQMKPVIAATKKVEVVWSAGSAGFSCTKAEAELEMKNFKTVLRWLQALQVKHSNNININLISSLGGLFETCGGISAQDQPAPIRSYGFLKLQQEDWLTRQLDLRSRIYRVSSAYGYISQSNRMGLIPTLVANGIQQKTSYFNGQLDTLRDYVWVDDVARFVVHNLTSSSTPGGIMTLASFKSHSIIEIKDKVENILQQEIPWDYAESRDNDRSISVCPTLRPAGFETSDIDRNIESIVAAAMSDQGSVLSAC